MKSDTHPAVVVVTYDRPDSLQRLLGSIERAQYITGAVTLIISIDHSDIQDQVLAIAEGLKWPHGPKRIVAHSEHRGAREHVLSCADFTEEYGAIIVLEDDLYVSQAFYDYAIEAQKFCSHESRIAGVSLYTHAYNETAKLAFIPFDDGADNYYLQLPSSWGQCWTREQWQRFRKWYQRNNSGPVCEKDRVPTDVLHWPSSSWKKYFIKYMVAEDLYFMYPRRSLSTNFMSPGTHLTATYRHLQVPLQHGKTRCSFLPIEDSSAVYDAFCEPVYKHAKPQAPALAQHSDSLTIDLYGTKPLSMIDTADLLTSKPSTDPRASWGRYLKPHEANIYQDIPGNDFCISRVDACDEAGVQNPFELANYYHSIGTYLFRHAAIVGTEHVNDSELEKIEGSEEFAMLQYRLRERGLEIDRLKALVEQYESSTIWRLSGPLRRLIDAIKSR